MKEEKKALEVKAKQTEYSITVAIEKEKDFFDSVNPDFSDFVQIASDPFCITLIFCKINPFNPALAHEYERDEQGRVKVGAKPFFTIKLPKQVASSLATIITQNMSKPAK